MTENEHTKRLEALCSRIAHHGFDAFIQPVNDEYQGEYTPACAQRLEWVSGFTGSAGTGLFLASPVNGKPALLLTDGRYTIQAAQQVDTGRYHLANSGETPLPAWVSAHLKAGQAVGYDAWLHTHNQIKSWKHLLDKQGIHLKPVTNLIDEVWNNRPAAPAGAVMPHPMHYAGEPVTEKCQKIAAILKEAGADAVLLALPDGINWLLNIRGEDILFNPLLLAFALVEASGRVRLIQRPHPFDWAAHAPELEIIDYNQLESNPQAVFAPYKRVMIDPDSAASWFFDRLAEAAIEVVAQRDPTLLLKSIKNPIEMDGIRAAHRRDGVALSHFLDWLAAQQEVSELDAVDKLEQYRVELGGNVYRGQSFATIAGSGPNGAIVHYRADEASNRKLEQGELFLLDSGGQYLDGTTDVTRTVAIGTPSAEMRDRFTRVLKGHIAIATARFPVGTSGSQLDALARQYLWDVACDYDHGTGHGVGAFLCVHEGPQRISKRGGDTPLAAGMVLSNEPGYYKTGEYGIRIENLVLVVPAPDGEDGRKFLQFETLTLAPLDEALIDESLLSPKEIAWLRDYHSQVEANNRAA